MQCISNLNHHHFQNVSWILGIEVTNLMSPTHPSEVLLSTQLHAPDRSISNKVWCEKMLEQCNDNSELDVKMFCYKDEN